MIRAVVGILKRAEKILIAERPIGKPYSGYWEFPGGKIERNETGQDALKRELYEELDIEVITSQPLFEHTHQYPDKTIISLAIYWVTAFSGEAKSKENQKLRWVTFPEMLELRLLEGNWPIMERIKELF